MYRFPKKVMSVFLMKNSLVFQTKIYIGVSTEKYVSDPLNYEGSELAKLYLYRGRANMQLGNKEKALLDFDKAVQLDPSYSEAYFRRAIANHNLDKG